MAKKKRMTAAKIKDEIDRRISCASGEWAHCKDCRVTLPREIRRSERQYEIANWVPKYFEHPLRGCDVFVMRIVNQMMREYDCSDW